MVVALALVSFAAGAVAAYVARSLPPYAQALETSAGFLFIGGFALAGAALPALL